MPVAPPISASTLALLRGIKEAAMLDDVAIESKGARVTLPGGGWEYAPPSSVTTKGMIGPLSKAVIEQFQADRLDYKGLEQLDVPMDTDVAATGTVTVTSARHGTTRKYTIEGVTPLGTYSVSRVLIVKAVG